MKPNEPKATFLLQVSYDQKELLGARWWQNNLAMVRIERSRAANGTSPTDVSRREALQKLLVVGGIAVVAGVVVMANHVSISTAQPFDLPPRLSLDLQKQQGLAVGASAQTFVYPDATETAASGAPLDRAWLTTLAKDLAPRDARLRPYYTPTLLQSLAANPGAFLDRFRMMHSPAMQRAFAQGEAVRELLQHAESVERWALVVDLPGPESIAFAAALQPAARAVFTFDNWPHPQGVVPSHLTLAAAVYHRSDFLANDGSGAQATVFVLDRDRLADYRDQSDRFDNRYVVKLPGAAALQALGITRVLYVVPAGVDARELDDLNETFVAYRTSGTEVRLLGLGDLIQGMSAPTATAPTPQPRYYWHGSPATHWWFWNYYAWGSRPSTFTPLRPSTPSFGAGYSPTRRSTMFDGVSHLGTTHLRSSGSSGSSGGTGGGSWSRSSGGYHGS